MKRFLSLLLASCMFIALLSGCSDNTAGNANGSGAPASDSNAGNSPGSSSSGETSNTVISHIETDIASFDPNLSVALVDSVVQQQIYDSLYFLTKDKEMIPRIATSYEISDDGLYYTFHLREGVKFHNGDTVTAEDVAFSFMRSKESPNKMIFVEGLESANVIDDLTVEFKLESPGAQFLTYVCSIMIVNKDVVESLGDDYKNNPCGCGPYMLESRDHGYQVTLTRFDDYYRGPARIEKAVYRVMTDLNAATIAIQAGDITFGEVAASSYENIAKDSNLKAEVFESVRTDYFICNNQVYPFDNKLVRQAISYAIDRQLLVDSAMEGFGVPTSVMIARSCIGYSDKIEQTYYYDVDKAKALLAEAGIQTPMDIGVIKCFESHTIDVQVMQQALAEIGLNATIETMELNKLCEELVAGDFEMGAIGISLYQDADSYSMLYSVGSSFNQAQYHSEKMDKLFADARAETDLSKREDIYAQICALADEEAIYIPAYYRMSVYAYDKDLKIDYFDNRVPAVYEMHWD